MHMHNLNEVWSEMEPFARMGSDFTGLHYEYECIIMFVFDFVHNHWRYTKVNVI